MPKTLKDIIKNSNDIYEVEVVKPNKHDHTSWQFIMKDPRWTDPAFCDYTFRTVHLRRDNGFFLAYKSDDSNAYFVDPGRSMYRSSITKYVFNLVDYSVKSNDISTTKNEPSFRVTKGEMKNKKISNFLDLCYYYRDYSAIGTGYTRDIRNLVVMDIDVDCTKQENKEDIENLLLLFATYDSLPDFYIFNHQSNHIQLQWVIKDLQYKDIDEEVVSKIITDLNNDKEKNGEIDFRKTDFTEISKLGVQYRRTTRALCDIVKNRRKFGDKNYTFWKAKNPMSALIGAYDLELRMPYLSDGEIKYHTQEEMMSFFSTKEARKKYFDKSPDFLQWYSKLSYLMDPLVEKVSEKKVMKIDDANDVTEYKPVERPVTKKSEKESYGMSRNTFVINCTRVTTWETAKRYGCRNSDDFKHLPHEVYNTFRKDVYNQVYEKFNEEDRKYSGFWPDTTNLSTFPISEFKKAFDSAFSYAIQKYQNFSYSDEDRKRSQLSRHLEKDIKLLTVHKYKTRLTKITRPELLKVVNRNLKKMNIRQISLGSLKRFIAEINTLSDDDIQRIRENFNKQKETSYKKKIREIVL